MSVLNQKVGRDLWQVKGQAIAIALVIAVGVMMLVMMEGLVSSLADTKQDYYQRYRLADVFAPLKRAPGQVLRRIANLPQVASVEARINGSALVDLPAIDVPIHARTLSLPSFNEPRLNAIYLVKGRQLSSSHKDEVLLLEGFALAHGLAPGDTLSATIQGVKRRLKVVGLAQAPEFLYTTAPGELVPDDGRFAVLWMNHKALEAAYDMEGAFNEVLISLVPGARKEALIHRLDQLLEPFGGLGAYDLDEHISNRFITEEIAGLKLSSRIVPPIFLAVAAFLLYIVVARMVQAQRPQIGLLKAFGYSDVAVAIHYLKFVMIIAISGAVVGCLWGVMAGRSLSGFYQQYYKFPFLVFSIEFSSLVKGISVSALTAVSGSVLVMRRILNLAPAIAMSPPAPPDYSKSLSFGSRLRAWLDQPTRMVLRSALRQPLRLAMSVTGIALGMALSVAMLNVMSAFNSTLDLSFSHINRSDVMVSFIEPLADNTLFSLQRIDGILTVEGFREVPVHFRHGRSTYRGSITALDSAPQLYRALDKLKQPIYIPARGIVLSRSLAQELNVSPGDEIQIDIREGNRAVLNVPVVALADTLLGSPAFMQLDNLNRLMQQPRRVSGAYLKIDSAHSNALYKQLKAMPVVAGVSLSKDSRAAFARVMDSGAGAMRFVMISIAAVITFGIIYNSARIAFSERARDLASLRVLGLTRSETGFILLGEIALITLLALPAGAYFGHYLSFLIAAGFDTDLYRIPVSFVPANHAIAAIAVILATLLCAILVMRDICRLDLVSSLKIRE
ncbi:ABC transporter permease [Lacimicrobium alkaliphilum]|uniref:ABC transporter permease n=1 Tax=Lacimicrobium alkaliphilum TaxID=1526571 RepID=A0A0U2Z916_9ALTE|nr:ABC transporter permease [Lacimicrobium alkaliphilum]ALS99411.1 ABC transporter permease [Lacimicrobium alkaliphilum]